MRWAITRLEGKAADSPDRPLQRQTNEHMRAVASQNGFTLRCGQTIPNEEVRS